MGSFLTIIVTLIVLTYAYLKADVLISRRDVDILSTVDEKKFTQTIHLAANKAFKLR